MDAPDATAPKAVGKRPENFDVVDSREARDPGLSGEGWPVAGCRGTEPAIRVGEGGGGGELSTRPPFEIKGSGWTSSPSVGKGDNNSSASLTSGFLSSFGEAWARRRERDEGLAFGEEFERLRVGNG